MIVLCIFCVPIQLQLSQLRMTWAFFWLWYQEEKCWKRSSSDKDSQLAKQSQICLCESRDIIGISQLRKSTIMSTMAHAAVIKYAGRLEWYEEMRNMSPRIEVNPSFVWQINVVLPSLCCWGFKVPLQQSRSRSVMERSCSFHLRLHAWGETLQAYARWDH